MIAFTPLATVPTTGTKTIEVVNNGMIRSVGTGAAIGILAIDNQAVSGAGVHSITLGNGSNIDVSSSAGTSATDTGVGVYSKISNTLGAVTKVGSIIDNGSTITLNKSGVGFFSDGSDITANGGSITTINGQTGKGIFTNKNVNTSKTITLLGDKSIGIHAYRYYAVDGAVINNSGNIDFSNSIGSAGAFASNNAIVYNNATITIGKSQIDSPNPTDRYYALGMAAKNGGKIYSI